MFRYYVRKKPKHFKQFLFGIDKQNNQIVDNNSSFYDNDTNKLVKKFFIIILEDLNILTEEMQFPLVNNSEDHSMAFTTNNDKFQMVIQALRDAENR